jgi:hypothetical protein
VTLKEERRRLDEGKLAMVEPRRWFRELVGLALIVGSSRVAACC